MPYEARFASWQPLRDTPSPRVEGGIRWCWRIYARKNKNKRLECLAIKCSEILNNNYEIKIFFAGDGIITLISEAIEVVMHDLGKAWNVANIPKHKI